MLVKNLSFEIAKKICEKHLLNGEHVKMSCKQCPLNIVNDDNFCAATIAYMNDKYGNIEIKEVEQCD